jgi:purine-nucleoside phosphorylase
MQNMLNAIKETGAFLKQRGTGTPRVGIVLGTGLNALINEIDVTKTFPYTDIPHFPKATVAFHKGQLIFGTIHGVPVVVMQGRFHYYEGYTMQQITFPVRVMKELGIEYLLLSNAAGGMNHAYKKGDLIITDDHINLLPDSPLRGLGDEFGNRFTDMSQPYSQHLQGLLQQAFEKEGLPVQTGVYVSVMGPYLETRAEYRWLRNTGADMVGMSTVPEVIAANQSGIQCAAVSVITDECDPDNLKPVNIAEIIEVAGKADKKLSQIFVHTICALDK